MTKHRERLFVAVSLVASALVLAACGGGSAGSKSTASTAFLQLAAEPAYGTMGATTTRQSFNLMTPSARSLVGANDFVSAPVGAANFIELNFNDEVLASSIKSPISGGTDGVVVRDSAGAVVSYFLDSTGAIDASNAFPSVGVAPALLRLYFESPGTPGLPARLAPDKYSISILPTNLRSASGRPFCAMSDGGLCLNGTKVVYHFTLDGMNRPAGQPQAPLASGPTVALPLPSVVAIDDELRIFFSDYVDLQSVVGFNTTLGRVNVTSQDAFCSLPFAVNNSGAAGENIRVVYTPPAPNALPSNYGFIAYMPDPFKDPTELRIRFIDISPASGAMGLDDPTGAIAGNGVPLFQNYSIGSAVWRNARLGANRLTPPSDRSPANMGALELPPKLPLPGSNSNGTAGLTITLLDSTSMAATDSSAGSIAPDGVLGVTDRARRPLAAPITIVRSLALGPVIANNPIPPDAHFVPNGTTLGGVDSSNITTTGTTNGTLSGLMNPLATVFDSPTEISSFDDIGFGAFLNPVNGITNPPRRLNSAGLIMQGISVGVPFPEGGTPESGLTGVLPSQPLGLRLYVVDRSRGQVNILNSHTFQPLGTIPGINSAAGLGMTPNGQFLYVSDFDSGTLKRVGTNPAQTGTFHQVLNTVSVGNGPTAVSVQPGNEDIFVVNTVSNSLAIIDAPTQTLRTTTPVGMGASDVFVTTRWTGAGTTFSYWAFTPNALSNSVTIYESDSPLLTVPNGPDGKVIEERLGFQGPRHGIWNRNTGAVVGFASLGALIANSQGSTVSHFGLTNLTLAPTPGFPGPPATRTFTDLASYSTGQNGSPSDVTIETMTFLNGVQRVILVTYPGSGRVAAIDYANGIELGSVAAPGTQIFGFLDQ